MAIKESAVGAYEAKTKLPELLRRVEAGERFTITNRGVPVANLVSAASSEWPSASDAVARMKALRKITGVSARIVRALIRQRHRY
jgi:prevent-host-death family protein